MRLALDHIAIAAPDLASGAQHVRTALGIDVPAGGAHPQMGTHNRLMRLGQDEFLEIIAIDPAAPPPPRPRWFGLDTPPSAPRLATWILRTDDLAAARAALGPAIGEIRAVSRGSLAWTILIPEDGSLPMAGVMPAIIAWPEGPLPGTRMADFGCSLTALHLRHPEADRLAALLAPHLSDDRISFETAAEPRLEATLSTRAGPRRLA